VTVYEVVAYPTDMDPPRVGVMMRVTRVGPLAIWRARQLNRQPIGELFRHRVWIVGRDGTRVLGWDEGDEAATRGRLRAEARRLRRNVPRWMRHAR
jgi:hypothetical protein